MDNKQREAIIGLEIRRLKDIMVNEIKPVLEKDIHNIAAIGQLDSLIFQFEGLMRYDSSISKILVPLYDIQKSVYLANAEFCGTEEFKEASENLRRMAYEATDYGRDN